VTAPSSAPARPARAASFATAPSSTYAVVMALFCGLLLISNVAATKTITVVDGLPAFVGGGIFTDGGALLFPLVVSSTWPWPVDPFHAQVYSAIFLAGAGGTYLVWKSAPREELLVLGLAQFLVGLLAVLGLVITDAQVHKIDWAATKTLCWLALFGWIGISGAFKLTAASRHFSAQSAS